jgi:hypothetical protein
LNFSFIFLAWQRWNMTRYSSSPTMEARQHKGHSRTGGHGGPDPRPCYSADEHPVKAQRWGPRGACGRVGWSRRRRPTCDERGCRRSYTERGQALGPGNALRQGGRRRGLRWRPGGGGIGPLGREPELGEDPADHPGILNGRDQAHVPPTARTCEHVTLEGAPDEVRPRPIARRAGRRGRLPCAT